jgi:hypothetical protein
MNSRPLHILILVWLICVLPVSAPSETVVFKTGKELKVEKAWSEKDHICFVLHGMKASVPKEEVNQIIKDNHDERSDPLESREESSIAVEEFCFFDPNGFRDLHWGDPVSAVDGLQVLRSAEDLDGVIEYVRPQDVLFSGSTPLTSIIYAFWQDQLYTVTIWTQGYPNFAALREMAFKQFGPGRSSDRSSERYIWTESLVDMMLEYIPASEAGFLWLRSCELDRKYKLARIKSHTAVLKWMHSRNARP